MHLDQVSASYMAPGSTRTHFRDSAIKQTTPIDGAIQKTDKIFTHWNNMPLDQVSASYMAPGFVRIRFPVSATKQAVIIDCVIQK